MLCNRFSNSCVQKVFFIAILWLSVQSLLAQDVPVTLSLRDVTVREAFVRLEKQSGYTFLYKQEVLPTAKKVSVQSNGNSLEKVLIELLTPLGLTFELDDKVIIVKLLKQAPKDAKTEKKAIVTGRVVNLMNEPLIGATIVEKHSGKPGVATDLDGNFTLALSDKPEHVLTATFIGMKQAEVTVDGQEPVLIRLNPSNVQLNDMVVVGAYGTLQKRSDLVGSAFQVNAEKIKNLPTGRLDNLLDGMVPGMQVTFNSDLASNTRPRYNLRVRGEGSLEASSEPLWVVDGVPIYTGDKTNLVPGLSTSIGPLSYINAEDIESITVLKDATSTSIYGANGSNGVILVTTKSGSGRGKPKMTLSSRFGVAKINKGTLFKVLNAEEYMTLAKEAWTNAGNKMNAFPFQDNTMNSYSTTDTDWSDVYYGTGSTSQVNLSLTGGTDKVGYYLSGSYYNNNLTVKGNEQQRYSLSSNTDVRINSKISLGVNLSVSYNVNDLFNPGDDYYNILPIYSPTNEDGTFRLHNTYLEGINDNGSLNWSTVKFFNSVAEREENENFQRTLAANANFLLKYDILSTLKFTSQFGVNYQGAFENTYSARSNWSGMSLETAPSGYSTRSNANFMTWTSINRLNYNQSINKIHQIRGILGLEAVSNESYGVSANGWDFVNDHIKEVSLAGDDSGSSFAYITRKLSFFGEGSYSYDNRYYLTLNTRIDGNSDFGADVRWAKFGSAGISWNVHNESFFNSNLIRLLKLKITYGTNGNSRLGSVQSTGTYTFDDDAYMGYTGSTMSLSPNPKLSWETSQILNGGVRIKLWDWLDLDLEAYNKKTINMISKLDVSRLTGSNRVYRNMGEMSNQGFDGSLDVTFIENKRMRWSSEFNFSHNKNTLLKLYNDIEKPMGVYIWKEGYDVNTLYLIRWAGVDPRDGAPLWLDASGNLTRVYNIKNRVEWKSSAPDLTGGCNQTLDYGHFSLNVLLSYQLGGYGFSDFGRGVSSDGLNYMDENQSVNQLDRWQKPGDLAMTPKVLWNISTSSVMNSTRYVYRTTYAQLRNLAISYNLMFDPKKNTSGLSGLRLSLIGDNLGLWTPYDQKNRNSYRQNRSGYPMETSVSLGVEFILN